MSAFIPTTLLTLYRGTEKNQWDEDVDDNTVTDMTDIPALVTEKSQRTFLPEEQRMTKIERYVIRLRPGTDVREEDRLLDKYTGAMYLVQEVINVPLIIGAPDVRVAAIRVQGRKNTAQVTRTGI